MKTPMQLLWISWSVSFGLIIIKAIAAFFTGSAALFASMLDSIMDITSTTTNLFFQKTADSPADEEHPYGHGKFEAFASFLQGLFIIGSAIFVIAYGLFHIENASILQYEIEGMGVLALSIMAPIFLAWFLQKNSANTGIIEAETEHFASDGIMNGAMMIGILASFWLNIGWIDSGVAIIAGIFIIFRAWNLIRKSTSILLDQELPKEIQKNITDMLKSHEGIIRWHHLRTRQSGTQMHADVHLEFPAHISLVMAHKIADSFEKKIITLYPTMHILTHFDIDDDSIFSV